MEEKMVVVGYTWNEAMWLRVQGSEKGKFQHVEKQMRVDFEKKFGSVFVHVDKLYGTTKITEYDICSVVLKNENYEEKERLEKISSYEAAQKLTEWKEKYPTWRVMLGIEYSVVPLSVLESWENELAQQEQKKIEEQKQREKNEKIHPQEFWDDIDEARQTGIYYDDTMRIYK
jgi:hypothetical protein